jgi:hypothetical protein
MKAAFRIALAMGRSRRSRHVSASCHTIAPITNVPANVVRTTEVAAAGVATA